MIGICSVWFEMKKVFFFEGSKSKETFDAVEVKEEKSEEILVEADKKEVEEELTETDVFENLGQLKHELMEFEKLGERIRTTISSIERVVPRLKESKELLVQDTDDKRKEVEYLSQKIPQLKMQKEELLQSIEQKQSQKKLLEKDIDDSIKEVEHLTIEVPKLQEQERNHFRIIQQNQEDLTRINDQIEEIESLQKYGVDFVSALAYPSQKKEPVDQSEGTVSRYYLRS